ncbi:dihydrofolate reductase family protein [Agromyces sp. NPDC056523]|uniref:dihydrofolate reductase family protein n=1 Tax=Agromyces sp. NPDC056523 TaxID=3345850 RepID=UPI003671CF07
MPLVTCDISVSMDGFSAGVRQSLDQPLGDIDETWLHSWMFERTDENQAEVDAIVDAGAFIMGRNMFGPDRGEWDLDWRGWWGDDPPYHGPVFVLAHRERDDVPMAGGTTFHFVTNGIHAALERARAAAGDRNVSIAGGASTVNQFLADGLIDELRVHVTPAVLGAGERLFDGLPPMRFEQVSSRGASTVTHVVYRPVREAVDQARA